MGEAAGRRELRVPSVMSDVPALSGMRGRGPLGRVRRCVGWGAGLNPQPEVRGNPDGIRDAGAPDEVPGGLGGWLTLAGRGRARRNHPGYPTETSSGPWEGLLLRPFRRGRSGPPVRGP